jgi:pyruvate,orthophosphate dikinase
VNKKIIYSFGNGKAEGDATMKELLGGKGANLAEMTNLGIPVPPGFTITTEVCEAYQKSGNKCPKGLNKEIDNNITQLEKKMDLSLGNPDKPLLISVRSGAAISMPGMMDTVLNLGLNNKVVEGLVKRTDNERFVYDAYRRLIDMFGDVVVGCKHEPFGEILEKLKKEIGVKIDTDLKAEDLKELVERYKKVYKKLVKKPFPQDVKKQLSLAIGAVFNSWNSPRAVRYRQIHNITGMKGTAVNIQAMVFGNMDEGSGSGVCFTRNPGTGENKHYGEYLMNAQGEDVVAGIRTPKSLSELKKFRPEIYSQLANIMNKLEEHYKDMQDIEFTIQEGKLYILQTRTGKRTAPAAVKIAIDMAKEKLITKKDAVSRIDPEQLDHLLHPTFAANKKRKILAKGLPASPGAAVGQVVFSSEDAEQWNSKGKKVILARIETSPEDIGGLNAAGGVLTQRGGMTSHAAVVARGMGKCCVAAASEIRIEYNKKRLKANGKVIRQGDWISLDGTQGYVIKGKLSLQEPKLTGDFGKLMEWADKVRTLKVRANADTPKDAEQACKFGAQGIGLCRTEHMFFKGDRIWTMRQMILFANEYATLRDKIVSLEEKENTSAEYKNRLSGLKGEYKDASSKFIGALKKLLPQQRRDFVKLFTIMAGKPVTIRLLDPPLHEFLPQDTESQKEMAKRLNVKTSMIKTRVKELEEFNPMLGHRGVRLAISYPEIYRTQVRAIIEAALTASKKCKKKIHPEIMIPLVGTAREIQYIKDHVIDEIERVFKRKKAKVEYSIGTMIEVPRAALTANDIAKEVDFFSLGTNDLTQMTMGFSRDDAGKFIDDYIRYKLLDEDPFQSLDKKGCGELIELAIRRGRKSNPDLKVGICGEHGGDPKSIHFCHMHNMDYVSCSAFRVPIARLAAAQAALQNEKHA